MFLNGSDTFVKRSDRASNTKNNTYCAGILEKIKCSKNVSCSAICVADILSNAANSTVFGVCRKDIETNGVDYLADLLT